MGQGPQHHFDAEVLSLTRISIYIYILLVLYIMYYILLLLYVLLFFSKAAAVTRAFKASGGAGEPIRGQRKTWNSGELSSARARCLTLRETSDS